MASPQLELTAVRTPSAVVLSFSTGRPVPPSSVGSGVPGRRPSRAVPAAAVQRGSGRSEIPRVVAGGRAPLPSGAGRLRTARPGASGRGAQPPLRLTRRGRRVVAGLSIAIGLSVAGATLATQAGGAGGGLELAGSTTVVVQAGDTLWSIAGELSPDEDRRAVVDALLDANGLSTVDLVPGQVLELP